jgi:ferredoxin
MKERPLFTPDPDQMKLWPETSGNAINGKGEAVARRPSPIYWHAPDATPHGPLQKWFYARTAAASDAVKDARQERQRAIDEPLAPLSTTVVTRTAAEWTSEVKREALLHAEAVGITRMRAEWVFQGLDVPPFEWLVLLAVKQDYDAMSHAPQEPALVEVTRQYARGTRAAKALASFLRAQGHEAVPHGGPMAGTFVLIPGAIQAGLGELGKHGSLIHPVLGSNFRLASVLTNAPLVPDSRVQFGADDFCTSCRICEDACPPQAIVPEKQLVRGQTRWYVDFDKCLPFFNENNGCAICLPACPFSRPEIGPRLATKLAQRRPK